MDNYDRDSAMLAQTTLTGLVNTSHKESTALACSMSSNTPAWYRDFNKPLRGAIVLIAGFISPIWARPCRAHFAQRCPWACKSPPWAPCHQPHLNLSRETELVCVGVCGHESNRVGGRGANRIRMNWWRIKESITPAVGRNVRNTGLVRDPCFPHHPHRPVTLLQNI